MHAGDSAVSAWLRRVFPLWLVVPLYAVPLVWGYAMWQFFQRLPEIGPLFSNSTMDGEPVPMPELPWGDFGRGLSMLGESLGFPGDWGPAALVPAGMAALAVSVIHRAASPTTARARSLPRMSAAVGVALSAAGGAISILTAAYPWVASDYFTKVREQGFIDVVGTQQRWMAAALMCLVLTVGNVGLFWLRPPAIHQVAVESAVESAAGVDGEQSGDESGEQGADDPIGRSLHGGAPWREAAGQQPQHSAAAAAPGSTSTDPRRPAPGPAERWEAPPTTSAGGFARPRALPDEAGAGLAEADLTAYRRPPRGGQ